MLINTIVALKAKINSLNTRDIALVPTMGALHEGHLSLIRHAHDHHECVIVSIFVNPLQFAPNEDYDSYPRTLDTDVALCADLADIIFAPTVSELYPHGQSDLTKIIPAQSLSNCLCGISRDIHFAGVLTVVAKLFAITEARYAYFGEKDYQQLSLIKRMVSDLNLDIQVRGLPIVREVSGLAMSSRNQKLSPVGRQRASLLFSLLTKKKNLTEIATEITSQIGTLEYLELRDADTLELTDRLPARLFVAVRVEGVRLIDNVMIY